MAPAVGILVMRQIGERQARQSIGPTGWRLALAASVAVALMVAWADFCFANSGRRAAREIAATLAPHGRTVWFQGHWGFQYYLRATGAREISLKHPQSVAGDFLVIPRNNTNTVTPSARFAARVERVDVPACRWLATVEGTSGIGFYSATWGPLPFAFGPAPDERYTIWRIKSDAGPIGK